MDRSQVYLSIGAWPAFEPGSPPAPATAATVELALPSAHDYLTAIGAQTESLLLRVQDLDAPQITRYTVQLAIHEACVNIMDHAYAGVADGRLAIRLILDPGSNRLTVDLYDNGRAFDPATVPPPDLVAGQVHGYGLFLIHALMDEVRYESVPGQNRWHLVKYF